MQKQHQYPHEYVQRVICDKNKNTTIKKTNKINKSIKEMNIKTINIQQYSIIILQQYNNAINIKQYDKYK